jgi:Ca-activated chloride channel family protein
MISFAQPIFFWLLPLALLPLAWRVWTHVRGRSAVPFPTLHDRIAVVPSFWSRLWWLPALLRSTVIALAIVALARPQESSVTVERSAEGVDIILVLDTSSSMEAEDFEPNRFEAARRVAQSFIEGRTSDRVGLIVFAAKAFTQAPLTLDYPFLQTMLKDVRMGVVEDGTAIGTALAMAVNRDIAATLDVRVYTVGVGTYGMAPYSVPSPWGGSQQQMMPVEIDEEMLREVAAKTGGRYYRATNNAALEAIYDEIGQLEKTEIDEITYTDYAERYMRFLFPAFVLLLLEWLLSRTRLASVVD